MSLDVRIVRTFGEQQFVRLAELEISPFPGLHVDYGDGTGMGTVARVSVTLREWSPGLHPPAITVRMIPEPADGLEDAKVAGWAAPTSPGEPERA